VELSTTAEIYEPSEAASQGLQMVQMRLSCSSRPGGSKGPSMLAALVSL